MSWSDCHAADFRLAFATCWKLSFWEQHGSPKFHYKPLNDLPWTLTPARRRILALSPAALLASRICNPWPSGDNNDFVARYLHLRYGRSFAIPLASRNSLPPYVQSSVPARWLAFSRVGLSNWFTAAYLGTPKSRFFHVSGWLCLADFH